MSRSVAKFLDSRKEQDAETVVIRPSATSLLCIDSDDRYQNFGQRRTNPTFPFQFNVQKGEAILNGFFKRMALTEFRMNWTMPNISEAWLNSNIIFSWKVSGGTATDSVLTLRDGFYDARNIATALQDGIQSLSSSLANFTVTSTFSETTELVFTAASGSNITFCLKPISATSKYRQLFDMINAPPTGTTTYSTQVLTGIPDLRATDYIDIVCSQLTYNQELKDTTSAPIARDMLARIYMDDPVGSSSIVTTNVLSATTSASASITAISSISPPIGTSDIVVFTVSAAPTSFFIGAACSVTGITGNLTLNGSGTIIGKNASGNTITVQYDDAPVVTGTPVVTSGTITSTQLAYTQTPVVEWDDRVNGVTPFVLYRQFPYPKQIRWNKDMPIGNLTFTLYDDQGRNIQDLWNALEIQQVYPDPLTVFANSTSFNFTMLVSED